MAVAHKFEEKARTNDVLISETVDFAGLLLSDKVLHGLKNSGFERPSPIQLKAIPLGRCGLDLIVQAKSGTGKTCVFSVIALEGIEVTAPSTQVLVLAPTREIAIQIWEVIGSIGSAMSGLKCHTFIGGLPLHEDKKKMQLCHIAVGTPGRIQNLIEHGCLKTDSIRLFILDEADKLLEESFQEQINWIYSALPDNKQMLALSATYPEYLADHLTVYMRNPTFIRLNISDPTLLGIKQYYTSVPSHPLPHKVFEAKTAAVVDLLSSVSFHQCLIFSNMQTRAQNLENELTSRGWPTTCIAGSLDQKDRIMAMAKLKSYKCRVLISTDLTSRGIDADRVNLVINLDVPKDHETYLHRIGRAGRFGSFGAGVTIVCEGQELLDMQTIERKISTHIQPLPDPIPSDLVKHQLKVNLDDVVSTEQLITRSPGDLPVLKNSTSAAKAEASQGAESLVDSSAPSTGDLSVSSEQLVAGTRCNGELSSVTASSPKTCEAGSQHSDGEKLCEAGSQHSDGEKLCEAGSQHSDGEKLCEAGSQHSDGEKLLQISLVSSEGASSSKEDSAKLPGDDTVPANHECSSQQSKVDSHNSASGMQPDTVVADSDLCQGSEGVGDEETEHDEADMKMKIQLAGSELAPNTCDLSASAKAEDSNVSNTDEEVPVSCQPLETDCEKDDERHSIILDCDNLSVKANFAAFPVSHESDKVRAAETRSSSAERKGSEDRQVFIREALASDSNCTTLPLFPKEKNGDTVECRGKELKNGVDNLTGSISFESRERVASSFELRGKEFEKLNLDENVAAGQETKQGVLDPSHLEDVSKNSDLKTAAKSEKSVSTKYSKAHSAANAWSSMLSGTLFDNKSSPPESGSERSFSSESSSSAKQVPERERRFKKENKNRKEKVSWETELALYVAARSKMDQTEDDEQPEDELSRDTLAADRPKARARRRLAPEDKNTAPLGKQNKEKNGLFAEKRFTSESGSVEAEAKIPQVPRSNGLTQEEATLPLPITKSAVNRDKEISVNGHGVPMLPDSTTLVSQPATQENELRNKPANKLLPIRAITKKEVYIPDTAREHDKDCEKQVKSDVDLSFLFPVSKPSDPLGSKLTYSSSVHEYENYLKKGAQPSILRAGEIVLKTFRVADELKESQLKQMSHYLNQFQAELKTKTLSSGKAKTDIADRASDSKIQFAEGEELSGEQKGDDSVEGTTVGGSYRDGGDTTYQKEFTSTLLPLNGEIKIQKPCANGLADTKSTDVETCKKMAGSASSKEQSHEMSVKSSESGNRRRQPRFTPMAVCGPATQQLFGLSGTAQESSNTVVSKDVPNTGIPVSTCIENGTGNERVRKGKDQKCHASTPHFDQYGLSSVAQEQEAAAAQQQDGLSARSCQRNKSLGIGAIPKKKFSNERKTQETMKGSSDELSSSSSSSTSDEDSSEEEETEKNPMCFQNYHAYESTVKGRKKKVRSRTHSRRKEQEKARRKLEKLSFQHASQPQTNRDERSHASQPSRHHGMNSADVPYASHPYAAQHNYYNMLQAHRNIPDPAQRYLWSYPNPQSFSNPQPHYQHYNYPIQAGSSYPSPWYPVDYRQWVGNHFEQHNRGRWPVHLQQQFSQHHPLSGMGSRNLPVNQMSAKKLANIQGQKAEHLLTYIRKMAKFYARFCKRDTLD